MFHTNLDKLKTLTVSLRRPRLDSLSPLNDFVCAFPKEPQRLCLRLSYRWLNLNGCNKGDRTTSTSFCNVSVESSTLTSKLALIELLLDCLDYLMTLLDFFFLKSGVKVTPALLNALAVEYGEKVVSKSIFFLFTAVKTWILLKL